MITFKNIVSRIFLLLIILVLLSFYYFNLENYINFSTLKSYYYSLKLLTEQNYISVVISFMAIYVLAVTFSIPGAVYMTLLGGFLFGPLAIFYVVISATLGAVLLFIVVRTALTDWFRRRVDHLLIKVEKNFQTNSFFYLLFLRLIPIFPFWSINIISALLNVRLKIFFISTLIGIIPASIIYVMMGNGLNKLLQNGELPDFNIIFSPSILFPLIGLAILSLLPILYKIYIKRENKND